MSRRDVSTVHMPRNSAPGRLRQEDRVGNCWRGEQVYSRVQMPSTYIKAPGWVGFCRHLYNACITLVLEGTHGDRIDGAC